MDLKDETDHPNDVLTRLDNNILLTERTDKLCMPKKSCVIRGTHWISEHSCLFASILSLSILASPLMLFHLFSSVSLAGHMETDIETICRLLSVTRLMIPPQEAFRAERHLVGEDADETGWLNVPGVPDDPSLLWDG